MCRGIGRGREGVAALQRGREALPRCLACLPAALRACLLGALAKLPGPGSDLRRPILVAWGQDRCLGGLLPGRVASKQALPACLPAALPRGPAALLACVMRAATGNLEHAVRGLLLLEGGGAATEEGTRGRRGAKARCS